MTDQDISKMAAEMYPFSQKDGKVQKDLAVLVNRLAAIKAAKMVRDHYEQKIALIHLTGK